MQRSSTFLEEFGHELALVGRALEFGYRGLRHVLVPWIENHAWTRRREKWERIADSEVASIVRVSLGIAHLRSDH